MGVPKFARFLKEQQFPELVSRIRPNNVDVIAFDMGGIIHKAAQITYGYAKEISPEDKRQFNIQYPNNRDNKIYVNYVEKIKEQRKKQIKAMTPGERILLKAEFYKMITVLIEDTIIKISPNGRSLVDTIYLAVDGVAPGAKIQQQYQRRFKVAMGGESGAFFDSNSLSPGTEIMDEMHHYIENWLEKKEKGIDTVQLAKKIIYSSHRVPGEGEHKIMNAIRNGTFKNDKNDSATIIYGMDADLIVLSSLAEINNIYLMREDVNDIIVIDQFRNFLIDKMGTDTAVQDFAIILSLRGNDFLPHAEAFEDMEKSIMVCMNVYKKTGLNLTDKNKNIILKNFKKYMINLAKMEEKLLNQLANKFYKYANTLLDKSSISTGGNKKVDYESFINSYRNRAIGYTINEKIVKEQDKSIRNMENVIGAGDIYAVNQERVFNMVDNYLNCVIWAYTYYAKGVEFVDKKFVYSYNFAPLLYDISNYLKSIDDSDLSKVFVDYKPPGENLFINPLHQLAAIIPAASSNILPKVMQKLYNFPSPIYDMYPTSAPTLLEGADEAWMKIAILPPIQLDRIIDAVNDLKWTQADITNYSAGTDIVYNMKIIDNPIKVDFSYKPPRGRPFFKNNDDVDNISNNQYKGYNNGTSTTNVTRNTSETGNNYRSNNYRGNNRGYVSRGRGGYNNRNTNDTNNESPGNSYRGRGQYRGSQNSSYNNRNVNDRNVNDNKGDEIVPKRQFKIELDKKLNNQPTKDFNKETTKESKSDISVDKSKKKSVRVIKKPTDAGFLL